MYLHVIFQLTHCICVFLHVIFQFTHCICVFLHVIFQSTHCICVFLDARQTSRARAALPRGAETVHRLSSIVWQTKCHVAVLIVLKRVTSTHFTTSTGRNRQIIRLRFITPNPASLLHFKITNNSSPCPF